ncbi:MAG: type II toxin-antitoxin system VapC family toxin [Bacillota bacterium]
MMRPDLPVVYWDASAIVSVLTADAHHEQARKWYENEAVHLLSTLCYAETLAVLLRLKREGFIGEEQLSKACEALDSQPWRLVAIDPELEDLKSLAVKWFLRGADLWHLALTAALAREFPEIVLLTFDQKLRQAAEGEGLAGTTQ